ncbi:MAG: thiamine pyrophosphate-requiring protein [Chloroflexi bacterium]|nr:thiamine pyrophosphate-requiring protein [Chloroflexota bacterium]MDA1226660.1 thiamine pyrophosphate-requiring protein [Chloroflexota bacterium]
MADCFQPRKECPMNGDQVLAKILKAEGVEWISCFPAQTLINACSVEGIRPVMCRQERAGVNMADGFSRVNNGNKIGVFTMQVGPGAENAFGGVAQAYADSVPILLIPGGNPAARQGVHPNFEAVPNYQGITKWAGNINMVERIPEMVGRAMTQLKHGRPGPVLLEFPGDVAQAEFPGTLDYKPVKVRKSGASQEDVRDLVTALLKAKNPVINTGQGVLYAEASDELVEFAELTNIPVMTTLAGKSAFPETHPLALGTAASSGTLMAARFLEKTDFVLGMGTSFTISNFNAPMPAGVTLGHSTNCAEDVNKDYRAEYGAIGDAKIVLQQMIEEVKRQLGAEGRGDVTGVRAEIQKIREEFMAVWGPNFTSDEVPISPYRVINEMMANVDIDNAIVTHDSGYPREQIVPFWPVTKPRGYLGWGKSTQLGYGLGLALGAKLAAPEKTVINIMGDAAFGMSAMDIETAARSNIGTLTIVLNNGVMTHYYDHFPHATEHWGSNKLGGDYAKVSEGLGAYAERVDNPDEVGPAIRRALEQTRENRPAVLEIMTKEEVNIARYWR